MQINSLKPPPTDGVFARRPDGGCLVVDDDPLSRAFVARRLATLGVFPTYAAATAGEALQLWLARRPAIVFIDCVLPEWDGYSLAREIRSMERRFGGRIGDTLLIGISGESGRDYAERCKAAGMDGALGKPASLREFAASLRLGDGRTALPTDPRLLHDATCRIGELHSLFSSTCDSDLSAARQAIAVGRIDRVAHHAHRILGASRVVGAAVICVAAQELSAAAAEGGSKRMGIALDELAAAYMHWQSFSDANRETDKPQQTLSECS